MEQETIKIKNLTQAKAIMQNRVVRVQVHCNNAYYFVGVSKKQVLNLIQEALDDNCQVEINLIGVHVCYVYINNEH